MKRKCLRVGLTGGFGSGKSTVRSFLQEWGAATVDADTLAKNIAAEDEQAIARIKREFGEDVYAADGTLQRHILAQRAFSDEHRTEALNRIIHPRVHALVDEQVAQFQEKGHRFVIIEAALFYETGWYEKMDFMAVVTAPEEKRRLWLEQNRGFSRDEINKRMQLQLPQAEKAARADYIIRNDGDLEDLRRQTRAFLRWLEKQSA